MRTSTRYMPGQMALGSVAAKYDVLFSALISVRQLVSCHLRRPDTIGTTQKMTIMLKMLPAMVSWANCSASNASNIWKYYHPTS